MPTVADLRVADPGRRRGDQRVRLAEQRVVRDVVVARERADRDPVAVLAHVAEVGQAADVDEQRRLREAELHQRQERVAAGEQLRVVARPEQLDRVVDRLRDLVVEPRGDHDRASSDRPPDSLRAWRACRCR